jgi:hypothetical protein
MANGIETTVVLGEYLDERVDSALEVLAKRNPDLGWTRDQLIRLAIGHGLDLLVRRHARKKTNLSGVLHTLSPGLSGEEISIEDISQGGIGFRMAEEPDMKVNQVFQVEFILDNMDRSTISKTLIITHVSGRHIGAEFCEPLDSYDAELMSYLSKD